MNKTVITKIAIMLITLVISSNCFFDKGNYIYKEAILFEIDTIGKGISPEMTALQFENIKIPVAVKYAGDAKNLMYEWKIYPQNPKKDDNEQKFEPPLILSTKAILDTILYVIPNKYYLTLTVTDNTQDIKCFLTIKLNVETKLSRGVCVLDEKSGRFDLNIIRTSQIITDLPTGEDKTFFSLFSGVNNREIENGEFLGFAASTNTLYVFTKDGGFKLNANTFMIDSDNYQSWYSFPTIIKGNPSAFLETKRPMEIIIDNGLLYVWDHITMGTTSFGDRLNGDYYAAPYLPNISTATFSTIIFDNKNKRFASVNQFGSNVGVLPSTSNTIFDLNNIGNSKQLLHMDNGFNDYTYAVFKDSETLDYNLYVADFSGNTASPIAIYDMNSCPDINENSYFAFANSGQFCFYSSGSKLYLYKYASTNQSEAVLTFTDETITGIKVYKDPNHEKNGKLLLISTLKNSYEGKLYLLGFNELNGLISKNDRQVFDGFGKIIDTLIRN